MEALADGSGVAPPLGAVQTKAKEIMLERTHIPEARWFVVQQVRYAEVQHPEIHLPLR